MDDITIEKLNKRGEGVAGDGGVFPDALPGEVLRIGGPEPVRLTQSPDRIAPICRHYGQCGGCAAQHMGERLYSDWKRASLVTALDRAGLHCEVGALVDGHGAGRRRATFHARFLPHARDEVGFMRARAHDIVTIDSCPLFCPEMSGALEAARALAGDLRGLGKPLDIQVTSTLNGLDVDIRGTGALEGPELRKLARTADALDLARVSNHGRTVLERRAPEVRFGAALVAPPARGFLQATIAGEEILAERAAVALKGAKKIAELFCGAGAFALRLAADHEVVAMDSDADAIAALKRGSGGAPDLRPVEASARDLFERPLRPEELASFDAVLFDPPRAGAQAQAKALAASVVPLVVAISCNVETFARDARILIDGGFTALSVTPLDQFRFSPHVEIIAAFRRPREAKRRRGVLS